MALNKYMHPRNIYLQKKPDFKALAIKYPEFRKHVTQDLAGKVYIDFKVPEALRALSLTLLKDDFGLDVELPLDRLIPTIPLRLNYLHWIEDIIGEKKEGVKGIDIGTGASCVYPLLGAKMNEWKFLATEVDETNFHFANENIEKNNLSDKIHTLKVAEEAILLDVIGKSQESYEFCMCNPPFFSDRLESLAVTTSRSLDRPEPNSVCTAGPTENVAYGGEVAFIKKMISDSLALKDRIRIYSSMVGKKSSLPPVKDELKRCKVMKWSTTEFCQGKTMRWGVAWTFDDSVTFPSSCFKAGKKDKRPLTYQVPFGLGGSLNYDVPSLTDVIKKILQELKIWFSWNSCSKNLTSLCICPQENTWSHQRRKRRQMMRADKQQPSDVTKTEGGGDNLHSLTASTEKKTELTDQGELLESSDQFHDSQENGPDRVDSRGGNSYDKETDSVVPQNERNQGSKRPPEPESNDEKGSKSPKLDDQEVPLVQRETTGDEANNHQSISSDQTHSQQADKTPTMEEEITPIAAKSGINYQEQEQSGKKDMGSENPEVEDTGNSSQSCTATHKSCPEEFLFKSKLKLRMTEHGIVLEMTWVEGQNREHMHQLMQYFKNKLQPPS